MVHIRNYRDEDAPHLWQLFFNTVRTINRKDYSEAAVCAWASDNVDPINWQHKMREITPFVAEINEKIVGYSDLQDDGLVDHFFCHHEHQGQGVGRSLMQHIFTDASTRGINRLHSQVSLTAQPFYLHLGFKVIKRQQVEVRGQILEYAVLEKFLES